MEENKTNEEKVDCQVQKLKIPDAAAMDKSSPFEANPKNGESNDQAVNSEEDERGSVDVVDRFGISFKMLPLRNVPGCKYTALGFNAEAIETMPDFKLRDDDVMIVSYPKTGCHWIWDILRMLQKGEVMLDAERKETCMMENETEEAINEVPSPRILNNHEFFDHQPKDIFKKKTKMIFLYRNMKDMTTSYWHVRKKNYSGTFSQFLWTLLDGILPFGSPLDYYQNWEKGIRENPDLPIFVCRYEDLKKVPVPTFRALAEFLEAPKRDEEFLQNVADATNIDKMRQRKAENSYYKEPKRDASAIDVMYRKGVVGDWKNLFTVADNEWFSQLVEETMKDTRFEMVYD